MRTQFILACEGLRLGYRNFLRRVSGSHWPKHAGSVEEICLAVAKDCWNGSYFCAGLDHLDQFWIRDFAICLEGLLDLGFEEECRKCALWALEHYERYGAITTTIFMHRFPVNIFHYSSDSLPFLLYVLDRLGLEESTAKYRKLLLRELGVYRTNLLTKEGAVRSDRMFSATKDTMLFFGTTYTYSMLAWLQKLCAKIDPLPDFEPHWNFAGRLKNNLWRGTHFVNDLVSDPEIVSADANFWPYWCDLFDQEKQSTEMLATSVEAVVAEGLCEPFPLKYHAQRYPEREVLVQRLFVPNYQGDSIWQFFMPQWLELASRVQPEFAQQKATLIDGLVESYGTWIEVYEPDGEQPLQGRLGHGSDWGMLWAASWPRVRRIIQQNAKKF